MRYLTSLGIMLTLFASAVMPASRKPVKARNAMVVSAESLATLAGVEVLRKGGNAIDAAVAVGFALAVTFPEAGNIGGGGFMLIRLADGRSTVIEFREKAPAAATRNMYLDSLGNPIPKKSEYGPLAAGVPGSVAGLLKALELYGTKNRREVMAHAIRLAEIGFPASERLAASFTRYLNEFSGFPSSMKVFTRNGDPHREGEIFRQPDLARTLRAIRDRGKKGFYEGAVADLIVDEMRRSGGIITREDLAAYEAVERSPLFGTYRGYGIITAPPPSAGGTALLEVLNILEHYDIRQKGWNSSQTVHVFAAAAQIAFADRARYLGDPDVVTVPVSSLIAKNYAAERQESIDTLRALPSTSVVPADVIPSNGHETTHFCVVDKFGNVVSVTTTINSLYGCKTVVDGAGFLLNNEMDDFVIKPGQPDLYELLSDEANSIAPHKRMISSMTPTIVLKEGKPYVVVGARGGGRIITAVAQVIMNVIDHGMNIQEAVDAPRVHHQWLPDRITYEPWGLAHDVMEKLQQMGYALQMVSDYNGRVEAMMIDAEQGVLLGGPDPREQGVAIGY